MDTVESNKEYWFRMHDGDRLEDKLGYTFKDPELLVHALYHSSYLDGKEMAHYDCNERLEFLGDAVCNMLVTEYLYKMYPQAPEGEMTNMKGAIVSGHAWAQTAALWNLGRFIRVGKGIAMNGGRYCENVVADAFEAVLGAVYLDGGLAEVLKIMETFHWPRIPEILSATDFRNFKSELLELVEKADFVNEHGSISIQYKVVAENGPEHERIFDVEVFLNDVSFGIGQGRSKKKAEQAASGVALEKLKTEEGMELLKAAEKTVNVDSESCDSDCAEQTSDEVASA